MRSPGSRSAVGGILFTIVVALLVVPIQMSLIPILQVYAAGQPVRLVPWHLAGAHRLRPAAGDLPALQLHLAAPRDLFESAAIDGASHFQTFIRIVLPLSMPALGRVRDLPVPVGLERPVGRARLPGTGLRRPRPADRLYQLIGSRGGSWHLLTAGAFLTMVVPLIVFLVLQRAFVRGILAGSVKS